MSTRQQAWITVKLILQRELRKEREVANLLEES